MMNPLLSEILTVNPEKPTQGGMYTICIKWDDIPAGVTEIEIEIVPAPATGVETHTFSRSDVATTCITAHAPSGAVGATVSDTDGVYDDMAITFA